MSYESEEINLVQWSNTDLKIFLTKQIQELIYLFIEDQKSLPKYQIFKLMTSPYWDDWIGRFVWIREPIIYWLQKSRHLIPDNPSEVGDVISICIEHILSQSSYQVCQKVIIYDQNNKMQRFALVLKDPIPMYSNIWWEEMLVRDSDLLYDFSHRDDELPSAI